MSDKVILYRPTHDELQARRTQLDDILTNYKEKKKEPLNREIITAMKKNHPRYDKDTLYKDRLYIMANDTFVSEMSIFRYSSTIREIFDKIKLVENKAEENIDDPKGFVKVNSLKLILEAQKLKGEILSGKAMDVSIELLGKKLRRLEDENEKLTNKAIN